MCCMTETGFRWQPTMAVPLTTSKWYVYERATGEHRYSQQFAARVQAALRHPHQSEYPRRYTGHA
jgi:hypothetical protein